MPNNQGGWVLKLSLSSIWLNVRLMLYKLGLNWYRSLTTILIINEYNIMCKLIKWK